MSFISAPSLLEGRRILAPSPMSGRVQLTGTAGVKTTLFEVPIPNGFLNLLNVRLDIEYAANYTNSANLKQYGIDLGSSAGTAVNIRQQSPAAVGLASETTRLVMGRSNIDPARFWITIPNNYRVFGNAPGAGATAGVLASALLDPNAAADWSLFFWAQLSNAGEQISFEHITVALDRS